MNGRSVTEATRERETFKYDPSLLTDIIYNESGQTLDQSRLRTSQDAVLTSIASLGASRLKTAASLISLFDQKWQYIVAEATPTISLLPRLNHDQRSGEQLWLCGTAIPRAHGVCEHTLVSQNPEGFEEVGELPSDLPLTRVEDLGIDERHCQKPWCLPGSPARFYAAVPIRSKRGINIGVYCVLDIVPRTDWDDGSTKVMRELSQTIMDYLELRRSKHEYRLSERMIRGLGSFVDGKATTTAWHSTLEDTPDGEGVLNSNQQSIQHQKDEDAKQGPIKRPASSESPLERRNPIVSVKGQGRQESSAVRTINYTSAAERGQMEMTSTITTVTDDQQTVKSIFSKAANIIRESIEIEGALFLDASLKSFGGLTRPVGTSGPSDSNSTSPSDSDEAKFSESSTEAVNPCCNILGFSTSELSSIDGAEGVVRHATISEKLLSTLLRRYPAGKVFTFDEHGALESSDSSDADLELSMSEAARPPSSGLRGRHSKGNPWERHMEGDTISNLFPGARSVAFAPVWDAKKDRWYAGCFAFTCVPTRVFSGIGELSYLRAFGMLTMSEIFRLEATLANKAKSDVLSSLSHELRSPLHGVVLAVELLHDTQLDVFQGDVLHTLETCGRTLLDTVDHLLDFAKINNYMGTEKKRKRGVRGLSRTDRKNATIEDGMKSQITDVRLDVLAEEVLESVFAGSNFQHLSVAQLARRDDLHADRESNNRLDSMQAMEEMDPEKMKLAPRDVAIFLDVDPNFNWIFSTSPGAIRRILMNLFGNSLKYTSEGTIKVSLTQEQIHKKGRGKQGAVKLTVADTGKGISEDFLRNDLFKPFSQEDTLAPGTGLGLSLVKQIVATLGGNISMQSGVGVGTRTTVTMPLTPVAFPSSAAAATEEDDEFAAQVQQLKGLRIRLSGLKRSGSMSQQNKNPDINGRAVKEGICRDWLKMSVVSEDDNQELAPDLVLCTETSLDDFELNRPPTVVVCANTLVAYYRSKSARTFGMNGVVEFISQPAGPRKLAKTLLYVFERGKSEPHIFSPAPNETTVNPFLDPRSPNAVPTRPKFARSCSTPIRGLSVSSLTCAPEELAELKGSASSTVHSDSPMTDHKDSPSTSELERPPMPEPISSAETIVVAEGHSPVPIEETEFLLVDDNAINLKILASYMKKLGRKYRTAGDGQQAVDVYGQALGRFRCVFMDISMPVMDGFEATRQIRTLERDQHLRPASIFALSGLASADAQQEAFVSGIDLFLTKPVKLKELSSILTTRELL